MELDVRGGPAYKSGQLFFSLQFREFSCVIEEFIRFYLLEQAGENREIDPVVPISLGLFQP